jgi:hypothetical protein
MASGERQTFHGLEFKGFGRKFGEASIPTMERRWFGYFIYMKICILLAINTFGGHATPEIKTYYDEKTDSFFKPS